MAQVSDLPHAGAQRRVTRRLAPTREVEMPEGGIESGGIRWVRGRIIGCALTFAQDNFRVERTDEIGGSSASSPP
jgi:hypothetical protein